MRALWDATAGLAAALRPSPIIDRFGGTLREAAQPSRSELTRRLQELFAGFGQLTAQPLLLSLNLGHIPDAEVLTSDRAGEEFHADSIAITRASLSIMEWLRSSMPRYPIRFMLPYTDPLSSRVVEQGFPDSHWPWLLDLRRAGFQRVATVAPQVAADLQVEEQELRDALGDLSSTLRESPVWNRYVAAEAVLTTQDEAILDRLVSSYRSQTRPEVIDAVEPGRVMRRMQHRHAAARLAEDGARAHGGAVAEYYAAFRGLDRAIGDVAALLSQLLLYGRPRVAPAHRAEWRRDDEEHRLGVSFKTDGILQRLNEVVRLETELGPFGGLVVVEGYSVSISRRSDDFIEDVKVTGVVLPQST